MKRIRSKLSYANVIATLALFGVLGGGAYAASVAKNSVKSSSIKNNVVRSADIKDNALSGADVNEGSLGQVPSAANADSAQSAQNAQTADSAQSAQTADSAQSAETAANSQLLEGRSLAGVITEQAYGSTNPDPDIALTGTPATVASAAETVAVGPADTVTTASLSLTSTQASANATCWLESSSSGAYQRISQFATVDFLEVGHRVQLTLVGMDNNAPKGNHGLRARCSSGTDVAFDRGDMVSQLVAD